MARRPNKHLRAARPLSVGLGTSASKSDGDWVVRTVTGAATTKTYRCPGCQQPISPGTPHVVAWPVEPAWTSARGVDERRHWHSACWQRRR